MCGRGIKLNIKITNNNFNLIIYDLNFGILFSQNYCKYNILFIKELFNEYLFEIGVLKIKKNKICI